MKSRTELRKRNIYIVGPKGEDWGPDYRNDPKTKFFCFWCQKDMNPTKPYRMIHLIDGEAVLHPEDEHAYVSDGGDLEVYPIGSDCAKRLGLEWTLTC